MSNPNLVGKRLRALRASMGFSQKQMAEWLAEKRGRHVAQSQVCDWEVKKRISAYTDEWLRDLLGMKAKKGMQDNG